MDRLFLTALIIFFAGVLKGQSFEGTMNYKAEYKFSISSEMEKIGITKEALIEKMKAEGTWSDSIKITYKRDNYLMNTSFSPAAWSIYKGETNKLYSFRENESDICTVTDVSVDLEEQMSGVKPAIGKTGDRIDVNGWMCEVVRVVWKSGSYEYYYHPSSFKVDSTFYTNYIYDGWAGYLKIAHSLPVRVVKKIDGLGTVTLTLSSYMEENVNDKIFVIPKLIPDPDLNIIRIANRELMRIKK
jgi:hypothetical protein